LVGNSLTTTRWLTPTLSATHPPAGPLQSPAGPETPPPQGTYPHPQRGCFAEPQPAVSEDNDQGSQSARCHRYSMKLLVREVALFGFIQPWLFHAVGRVPGRCLAFTANLSNAPTSWWARRTRDGLSPLPSNRAERPPTGR
jgi:hypothetical protein